MSGGCEVPEHIAAVVSKLDRHPVDKMMEGEREKLLQMEDAPARASSARNRPSPRSSNAVRRARAGLQDPNRPIGSFLFLSARPASARRS
jgi:ATP-dependent Clp protease ATP-binding subunit ClpB